MLQRKFTLFILTAILLPAILTAQDSKIEGLVLDESYAPATAVTVTLLPSKDVRITDSTGAFRFSVKPGNYSLMLSLVSYKTDTLRITVTPGAVTTVEHQMRLEGSNLQNIVVTGRRDRTAESILNVERKESNLVIQKVGAKEMERKGASNVAEGLSKVTGVSFVGGQQLFIRGLGDRYNNAILNGLPVPSPNPDMKVIPLDIFPSGLVSSLSVIKSYSSDFYGDFSGGTIDIITKDYPDKNFFKIAISGGANSIVTRKDFYTPKKGFETFAGFTRAQRGLPAAVKDAIFYRSDPAKPENPFKTDYSPIAAKALPKMGLTVSGGAIKRYDNGKLFGFSLNAAFKNNYQIYKGIDRLLNADKVELFTNTLTNYRYLTNTSVLGSAFFKPSEGSSIKYSMLFVNDSEDQVSMIDGINPDLGPVFSTLNTNIQNTIFVNQFNGKHALNDKFSFNWGASYGITEGSLPDRTQVSMLNNGIEAGKERRFMFNRDVVGNTHKFFGALSEREPSGKLEIEYNKGEADNSNWFTVKSFKIGVDARYKQRTFNARQVDVRTSGMTTVLNPFNIDTTLTANRIGDGYDAGTWAFTETYYPSNNYKANLLLGAVYGLTSISFGTKTDLIAGVRGEYSDQTIFYKQSNDIYDRPLREFKRDNLDILPFLTLKYRRTEKNNILFSASRSLTRPLFLELTPFRFNQGFNRLPREGNPRLENSVNYNADFKFEIYPTKGELIAITVFGKYIQNPIEQALIISSDRLTSFFNSESARVFGAEFELVHNLGNLFNSAAPVLKNTSVGLNVAYINTEITVDPNKVNASYPIAPTNQKRPMYGASPYLVNADISYRQSWGGSRFSQATLTYNVYGKRVVFAGTFGSGDVYEMPAGSLDLVINNQVTNRLNIDLSLGNILNPAIRQRQFFKNDGVIVNQYMRGSSIALTIGYNFL